jgi:hypothetical protein
MKDIKTFTEFTEASVGQWHKRGVALGAAAGAGLGVSGVVSSVGVNAMTAAGLALGVIHAPMLAIPLAAWGALTLGVAGLVAGGLFAGGTARKDFDKINKIMKSLKKFDLKSDKTERDVKLANKNIDDALYLICQLRDTVHRKLQHGSSEGLLRRDIRKLKSFQYDLDKIERALLDR